MTEKRFKHTRNAIGMQFISYDDNYVLLGTFADDDGVAEIVELLNMLHEENILLEQSKMEMANSLGREIDENEQLKQKVDFYKYFQKDARELEKENEQLKSENYRLQEEVNRLSKLCFEFQDGAEWLRNNTVWEQMPTNIRTSFNTTTVENPYCDKRRIKKR